MRTTPQIETNSLRGTRAVPKSTVYAERTYLCLTIAFMLLLLASL